MQTGSCLCGAVRYAVDGPFLYSGYCHCSQCQRSTGSAFNAYAGVGAEALRITLGAENAATYAKNEDSIRTFCRICGSSLFTAKPLSGRAHIRMGTLDGTPEIRPTLHTFVGSKAAWDRIADDLPQFESVPPPRPKRV
jgi:hypothetical protein